MKLRDRATTCVDCGAYDVLTTDPITSRLRIIEARVCTCPALPKSEPIDLPRVCIDCGEPCRINARRCTGCKGDRDRAHRQQAKRNAHRRCEDCGTGLDTPASRRCPACRAKHRNALRRARRAA